MPETEPTVPDVVDPAGEIEPPDRRRLNQYAECSLGSGRGIYSVHVSRKGSPQALWGTPDAIVKSTNGASKDLAFFGRI